MSNHYFEILLPFYVTKNYDSPYYVHCNIVYSLLHQGFDVSTILYYTQGQDIGNIHMVKN